MGRRLTCWLQSARASSSSSSLGADAIVVAELVRALLPMKIVSLLPSLTEVCGALGLADNLVGITHGCDYPPEAVTGKPVVTSSVVSPYTMSQAEIHEIVTGALAKGHSLYGLNADLIKAADADLVLTQALCDVCAVSYPKVLSECAKVLTDERPRVVSLEPTDLEQVFATILQVGEVAGVSERAVELVASLRARHALTISAVAAKLDAAAGAGEPHRPSVAFLEWTDPLFAGGHWVAGQVESAGGTYCAPVGVAAGERSRVLPMEDLVAADPEFIFIAPCGFEQTRAAKDAQALWAQPCWRELRAVRAGNVYALDANSYFARPGPRLVEGAALLAFLMHGITTEATPEGGWLKVEAPAD